jgi:hypothetical protein
VVNFISAVTASFARGWLYNIFFPPNLMGKKRSQAQKQTNRKSYCNQFLLLSGKIENKNRYDPNFC